MCDLCIRNRVSIRMFSSNPEFKPEIRINSHYLKFLSNEIRVDSPYLKSGAGETLRFELKVCYQLSAES